MSKLAYSSAFRFVIVFTMACGMLLSPTSSSASHNPLALAATETLRHADLAAQIKTHGHAHDDGVDDEQNPGHIHGHNPADHAHETPSAAPDMAQPIFSIGQMWHVNPLCVDCLEAGFRLERPPRPVAIA